MNDTLYVGNYQKRLLKKWGRIIESGGSQIQSQHDKVVLAQVLENTHRFFINKGLLTEAGKGTSQADVIGGPLAKGNGYLNGADGYPGAGQGDYYLPNVVFPMLRRIMPDLIANELVSVQPLDGPVGFALAYRPLLG